jgi:hypothetical protein
VGREQQFALLLVVAKSQRLFFQLRLQARYLPVLPDELKAHQNGQYGSGYVEDGYACNRHRPDPDRCRIGDQAQAVTLSTRASQQCGKVTTTLESHMKIRQIFLGPGRNHHLSSGSFAISADLTLSARERAARKGPSNTYV